MKLPERSFVFLRHGETAFNKEGRLQGHSNVPLNETGMSQARAAAALLADHAFSRIVASPAIRVQQTLAPLRDQVDVPVHVDEELMEFFVGSFEGRTIASIREEFAVDGWEGWLSIMPDDADKWDEFQLRVCSAVARWTDRHPDETLLFVSHGLVFRALCMGLTGEHRISQNAEPHVFRVVAGGWEVEALQV